MTPHDSAIDALATYRLTRLLVEDEITSGLREKVFERFPPESAKVGYLFTCPYCMSVWVAAVITASRAPRLGVFSGTVGVLRYTMALSGAVCLVREVLDR